MTTAKQLVEVITQGIQEKKGQNIVIVDMQGIDGAICNYFVICSGNSPTQVSAIMDSVEDMAREKAGEKPIRVVGEQQAQWIAMDYADVMVHIFLPETREFYNVERLWEDAALVEIPNVD
ncbi:MAG: ribosome silencing factor [Prevotella sp.]|uniref:ribosome silencing factor n=1 Tax=Prevotella sp. TaxID=59823 RepID=UPI002A26B463|nr:ribosome silencing factor [Prevotella sp.]MDD7319062.1 ribosome silencing factor [Prevotellaceae bacterium]MDY4020290.1 ribosome silencing factor [Prevotella sp.]